MTARPLHHAIAPLAIALALSVMMVSAASHAQQAPPALPPEAQNPAVQAAAQACAGDIQKFCPNVAPGGGRIIRCLVWNQAGVSEVCRAAIFNAKAALGR